MLLIITVYILGGILAGLSAGLLGVGGGLVNVPFLAFVLPYLGFPSAYIMHVAVTTSLMMVVGTSLSSIIAHYKKGGILWDLFWKLLPGLMMGSVVAAFVADAVSSHILEVIFGVFAFVMAYNMLFQSKKDTVAKPMPSRFGFIMMGFIISGVCNLLGLGGGSLMVPFLNRFKLPMRNSVATSALCGFPIALVGVICLMILSSHENIALPAYSTGFLYWPACIAMLIPSIITAPIGATWAHTLSSDWLEKIFGFFLIIVGLDMLAKTLL